MPRVTQYIRDDDMAAWQAIPNKSEWIHEHLDKQPIKTTDYYSPASEARPEPIVKNDAVVKEVFGVDSRQCKIHGTNLTFQGKCLQKGCKYA